MQAVRSLIELVKSTFPDQSWDGYLKELDSAADGEFHLCYGMGWHCVVSQWCVYAIWDYNYTFRTAVVSQLSMMCKLWP